MHGAVAALLAAGVAFADSRSVVFTRADLFAPSLAQVGLSAARVIYVECGDDKSVLTCFEQGLRHPGLGAVVAEVARLSMTASRRSLRRKRRERSGSPSGGGDDRPRPLTSVSRRRL